MIRIKCPKCSTPLKLDDDQAGQVGVCDDCGAKFRVPAAKAAAPARPRKDDDAKKRPPTRRDVDDEDDDEGDDEGSHTAAKRGKKRKSPQDQEAAKSTAANVQLGVTLAALVVIFGLGGMYIRNLGLIVAVAGGVGALGCLIMLAKKAMSGALDTITRELIGTVGLLALAAAGYYCGNINDERFLAQRKETRAKLDQQSHVVVMRVHEWT